VTLCSPVREHQQDAYHGEQRLLKDVDKVCCGSQAVTLAHVAIETRHKVGRTPGDVRKRILHLPVSLETTVSMPLLLEWHPAAPPTTVPVNNNKVLQC